MSIFSIEQTSTLTNKQIKSEIKMACQIIPLTFLVRVDKGFSCQERIGEGQLRTNQTVLRCFQEHWGRSKQCCEGCGTVSLGPEREGVHTRQVAPSSGLS